MKIFCLYDTKMEEYMTPNFYQTLGVAVRQLIDFMDKDDHPLARHADDYILYELGEFDVKTGQLINIDHGPKDHGRVSNYKIEE